MSITFYVTDLDTRIQSAPAPISPRELAAFRKFMREAGVEIEDDPDGEPEQLTYAFNASICRFAIAVIAPLFGNRPEAIAVIEEAQFLGRLIAFGRTEESTISGLKCRNGSTGRASWTLPTVTHTPFSKPSNLSRKA